MNKFRSLFCLTCLAVACVPAFAGPTCLPPIAVTPEPSLGIVMAVGVGAVVLIARKMKGR
jgi:hypothetical protein